MSFMPARPAPDSSPPQPKEEEGSSFKSSGASFKGSAAPQRGAYGFVHASACCGEERLDAVPDDGGRVAHGADVQNLDTPGLHPMGFFGQGTAPPTAAAAGTDASPRAAGARSATPPGARKRASFLAQSGPSRDNSRDASHIAKPAKPAKPLERSLTSNSLCSEDGGKTSTSFTSAASSSFQAGANQKSRIVRSQHTVANLLSHGLTTKSEKESFKLDVETVRARISTISHRTLDPRSRFIRSWDIITIIALAYTAFVTPFEVAFFEPAVRDPRPAVSDVVSALSAAPRTHRRD